MTFVITQPCIDTMDQSCVDVCPVDCIHFEEGKDRMLYIDPSECIDCGACQPACPVSAIFPEADVPGDMRPYSEINSLWYSDADAARAKVAELVGAGGGAAPAPAAAEAPAAEAPAAAASEATPADADAQPAAEAPAQQPAASGDGAGAAPSAPAAAPPAPAPEPQPARRREIPVNTYKFGEAGVEGKCAICGQYVIKGGVKFGRKSVLCPEDAKKLDRLGNPYRATPGRR